MKIAICFSGQIRTGVESSPNLLRFIGELIPYTDFFIHTWNNETKKNYNGCRILGRPPQNITEKINKISEIYKPKIMCVEEFEEVVNLYELQKNDVNIFKSIPPLWYSFQKSVELKNEYELKNKFKYDYVVKLRPDIIFPSIRNLKDEIELTMSTKKDMFYIENFIGIHRENKLFVDDVYFFSNSEIMDVASKYYTELSQKINKTNNIYPYKYAFLQHLNNHQIDYLINGEINKKYKIDYSYTIYREECLHLSPMTDFNGCKKCEHYYFNIPKSNDNNEELFVNHLKKIYNIKGDVTDLTMSDFYVDELKRKTLI
jgi:hypothetical protein